MGPPYGKLPITVPILLHIFRDSYGSGMDCMYGALSGSHVLGGSLKIPLGSACNWNLPPGFSVHLRGHEI